MKRRRRQPTQDGPSSTIPTEQRSLPNGLESPDLTSADMVARQKEALSRLVQAADEAFQEKQAASARRDWCNPIPVQRKVDTVQDFLKAFHDEGSMEIATCSVCYIKKKPQDLDRVD